MSTTPKSVRSVECPHCDAAMDCIDRIEDSGARHKVYVCWKCGTEVPDYSAPVTSNRDMMIQANSFKEFQKVYRATLGIEPDAEIEMQYWELHQAEFERTYGDRPKGVA